MSLLGQIIIGVVMLGGVLFAVKTAWTGFKEHVAAPYVQAQIASDQKVVTKANENQAAAEGERDHAREDTKACVAAINTQTEAIAAWERISAANFKASKDAKARASKEATDQAPHIAELQAKAAAAPMLMACQDELAKARPILQDQLRLERGIPLAVPVSAPVVTPMLVK